MIQIGDLIRQPHQTALRSGGFPPPGVAQNPVPDLPGQVQPLAGFLQLFHHPDALLIMAETPGIQLIQDVLPGMAKGRMPQVMTQGDGLRQILIETQSPGNGPGNLGHLQRVGQPGAVVVPLGGQKHLGLVLQPPEGLTMKDPIPVPLIRGAQAAFLFRPFPSPGILRKGRRR